MSLARMVAIVGLLVAAGSLAKAAPPASPRAAVSAGGLRWSVPAGWTAGTTGPMRVASYLVPAAKGSTTAECAVFFFGAGQGGSVDANVERWARQFEGAPTPKRSMTSVGGLRVTRVEVSGTYLAPGGAMMLSTGKRPGQRLLGAIAEGPDGNLFFKLTGPSDTVDAARAAFDGLVGSLRKR